MEGTPGVRQLRIVLGRGGQGGGMGQEGQYTSAGSSNIHFTGYNCSYGADGVDGQGGEIWYGVINCNEEQEFEVHLGAGGAPGSTYGQPGALGEHTTFGVYSSENGRVYENGYTDIANGQAFARTGVATPLPGTGTAVREAREETHRLDTSTPIPTRQPGLPLPWSTPPPNGLKPGPRPGPSGSQR